MTGQEAFDNQVITQFGSAALMIARQAGAAAELQNELAAALARIKELEDKYEQKPADTPTAKPADGTPP